MKRMILLKTLMLFTLLFIGATSVLADTTYKAVTTKNPNISEEQFEIMIGHLNKDKLFIEADAWLALLEQAAENIAIARLNVYAQNKKIKVQEQEEEKLEEQKEKLEEANETTQIKIEKETKNLEEANEKLEEQKETSQIKIEKETKKAEEKTKEAEEKKLTTLEKVTILREKRTAISDRLNLVLSEINERIGSKEDGTELDEVLVYRRYMNATGGIAIDLRDTTSAVMNITGWLMSEEGGIRWLINIVMFFSIIVGAMFISFIVRNAARKALKVSGSSSQLLNDFILNVVSKIVMLAGILIALSALEINVGPIMAIVGAAGFVIAFALQGTLSNFASGIMMMLYRPFDIGDVIDVADIIGTVKSMNLVSTSIMTADNRLMVIPNNTIWGGVITNITYSNVRRVDLTFGIGYGDDMAHAQKIMEEILESNPLVLNKPAPTIKVHELADSSVNFICRPWVRTIDYWTVYWDVTRAVKERFDEEGISIPFPQTDIHIIKEA